MLSEEELIIHKHRIHFDLLLQLIVNTYNPTTRIYTTPNTTEPLYGRIKLGEGTGH